MGSSRSLHKVSGRWKLGLALALTTVVVWAMLPVVLTIVLTHMDAITISCYRFLFSALVLGMFFFPKRKYPNLKNLGKFYLGLLALAALMLGINYITFVMGLDYTSASSAVVVIQIAPMFFVLGSLVIFKEKFNLRQALGYGVLVLGIFLFFNHKIHEMFSGEGMYLWGVILVVIASLSWAVYAFAQKQLLTTMSSQGVLFYVFIGCFLLLLPFSVPTAIVSMDDLSFWMLVVASVSTLLGYGAFSEALVHWEASKVGMVLSLGPLVTLAFVKIFSKVWPDIIIPEELNLLSIMGAWLVVLGSMFASWKKTVRLPSHA